MATITKELSVTADRFGNPLMSDAQTKVADASVAHVLNATFSNTEGQNALNALGTKINTIYRILEAHGLMKAS